MDKGAPSPTEPLRVSSLPGNDPSRVRVAPLDFDAAAFGERIKGLRADRRMSLEEVGNSAGFTKSHVWELETGRSRNPTVRAVWSLARALGVTPAQILGLDDQGGQLDPTAMEIACMVDRALRARAVKEQIQLLPRDSDGSSKGGDAHAAPFTTARAEGIAQPQSPSDYLKEQKG